MLNVHFHAVIPDAVFTETTHGPEVHLLPPPADEEVEALLIKIVRRITKLLEQSGLLDAEVEPDDMTLAMAEAVDARPLFPHEERERYERRKRRCALIDGFSLHADVHILENDRLGLERLLCYAGRAPIALDRLP